jgi:hypothetical protein
VTIKLAINGYGRIGRNILRAHYEGGKKRDIAIVAINDLGPVEANAHLGKALGLSERMTDGPAQQLSRLRLQIAHGNALIPIRGHGALEFTQPIKLLVASLDLGLEIIELVSIYYGMWAGSGLRAELGPMQELAKRFSAMQRASLIPLRSGSPTACSA